MIFLKILFFENNLRAEESGVRGFRTQLQRIEFSCIRYGGENVHKFHLEHIAMVMMMMTMMMMTIMMMTMMMIMILMIIMVHYEVVDASVSSQVGSSVSNVPQRPTFSRSS